MSVTTSASSIENLAVGRQTATILIVDDEQGILDTYQHYLGSERRSRLRSRRRALATAVELPELPHYHLLLASTGELAIELMRAAMAEGRRVQAGFFDMKMPGGMDGLATIREVLRLDPDVLCAVVTAHQDQPLSELRQEFGPERSDQWDYLSKPFSRNEIVQKAQNMVASWHRRRLVRQHLEMLRGTNSELEERVKQRTEELSDKNRRLARQQQRLESALDELARTHDRLHAEIVEREKAEVELRLAHKLEAVGRLAAGIAHEINTPAQYIRSNAEFLSDAFDEMGALLQRFAAAAQALPDRELALDALRRAAEELNASELSFFLEELPDALGSVHQGIESIGGIVAAMRELVYTGKQASRQPCDLNRVVDNCATMARSSFRNVATVELDIPADLPRVHCHLPELSQVLINLITNAAHALEEAGRTPADGRLEIRARAGDARIEIAVTDNGMGIPDDEQESIFDPFYTTKDVGRGTGQGLAIARSIVCDRHGGSLTVRSKKGEGSTFTVTLPLAGPEAAPQR